MMTAPLASRAVMHWTQVPVESQCAPGAAMLEKYHSVKRTGYCLSSFLITQTSSLSLRMCSELLSSPRCAKLPHGLPTRIGRFLLSSLYMPPKNVRALRERSPSLRDAVGRTRMLRRE